MDEQNLTPPVRQIPVPAEPKSKLKDVSVVLVLSPDDDADQRIWTMTRELGKVGYRAEVLLVKPFHEPLSRITYRPYPKVFNNLAAAIKAARFQEIAIVDAGAELAHARWQTLVDLDPESIRTSFDVQQALTRSKRFWFMLLAFVTRLLLKTRRHPRTAGITIFRMNQVKSLLDQLSGLRPSEDLTMLLASARQIGQAPTELVAFRRTPIRHRCRSRDVWKQIVEVIRFWFNKLMFPAHQSLLTSEQPNKKNRLVATTGLLLLAAWALFGTIDYPLLEPDESRNAQLALNLLETGNWQTPMLNDQHYWDKPPLQHWAIATSYQVFGASPWATRFPIALASMLTILLTLFVGKRLVGYHAAWLASLCLLLSTGFLLVSRYTTMDASLTTAVTAAMLYGLLSIRSGFSRHLAGISSLAMGVGILIKGPVIVALCLPPLVAAHWLSKPYRQHQRHRNQWAWWVMPGLCVATPWYLLTSITNPEFVSEFLWKHNVVRFTEGFNHERPFFYYLLGIFLFMFPVSYLFPSLVKFLTSRKLTNRKYRSRETGWIFLAALWILAFFTVSTTKLPTYIVPAFPLITMLLGIFLEQKILLHPDPRKTFLDQLVERGPFELAGWCLLIGLVSVFAFNVSLALAVPMMAIALALGAFSWYAKSAYRQSKSNRIAWSSFAVMTAALGLFVSHGLFPAIASQRSDHLAVNRIVAETARNSESDRPLHVMFYGRDPFAVSIEMHDVEVAHFDEDQTEDVAIKLLAHPETLIVGSTEPMQNLIDCLAGRVELVKQPIGRHIYRCQRLAEPQPTPRIAAKPSAAHR